MSIPDSFRLVGAVTAKSGSAVLWGHNTPGLLYAVGAREVRAIATQHVSEPIGAAFVNGDRVIEVVDARQPAILELGAGGNVRRRIRLDSALTFESAVRGREGWILLYEDRRDKSHGVMWADRSGATVRVVLGTDSTGATPRAPFSRVSNAGDDALVTSERSPFVSARIGRTGEVKLRFAPAATHPVPAADGGFSDTSHQWVALRLVAIPGGYVQTLSDLRSDRRANVLFDADGRLLRVSFVDAPLAILSRGFARDHLLVARTTDRLELVTYQWRWAGPMPDP